MQKIKIILFTRIAIISTVLGYIGISCCTIIGGLVLSALGITAFNSFLVF